MDERRYSTRLRLLAPAAAVLAGAWPTGWTGAQADEPDAFRSMLALVPARIVEMSDGSQFMAFADLAAQVEKVGVERPRSVDNEDVPDEDREVLTGWLQTIESLYIAEPFLNRALQLTRDVIGFDLTDVDQVLEAGVPPAVLTFLRGRFDLAALETAWLAQGYDMLEVDGVRVASLAPDGELDLTHEIQRLALGRLNNAALLEDGTLVYAATLDLLRSAIATAAGAEASLADRVDIAALLDALEEPVASAVLVPGTALAGDAFLPEITGDTDAMATEIAARIETAAEMPPIALALLGFTPGGPLRWEVTDAGTAPGYPAERQSAILVYALMAMPGSADTAAEVVLRRLESMQSIRDQRPYAEFFASWEAESLADGQILKVELIPVVAPRLLWNLLFSRDLLFLAW